MLHAHLRTCLCCLLWCLAAALGGCGGGSNSSVSNTSGTDTSSFPASAASLNDPNVVPIAVESGPGNNVNIPYVSVTVCSPGTSTCKTIDHILLDTGSTGLRVFASVLNATPALVLPTQRVGSSSTITECAQFLNAVAWGSVQLADVRMGSKVAAAVPVQVLEPVLPTALASGTLCGSAPVMAQPSAIGANGVLGLSLFGSDRQRYFNCANPDASCQVTVAPGLQVQNPVGLFETDNNGVLVQLPALGSSGARAASGFLVFGVGTQTNNRLGSANVVPVNPTTGFFSTIVKGRQLSRSFMDSGSNGLFFNDPDAALSTACRAGFTGFYCPPVAQTFSASILLASSSATVNFAIDNADRLFQTSNYAFNNLGGTLNDTSFDWGLPFFFGRSVFTVIEGHRVGSLSGPFYAFTN
jgi:hypothetical protein